MSNLAVKKNEQQSAATSVETPQPKMKKALLKVTRFEKLLYGAFIIFLLYACVSLITDKVEMYKANSEFSKLQKSIEEQKKENEDLQAEVEQLSRYERIAEKAKELGLEIDENNVQGLNQ